MFSLVGCTAMVVTRPLTAIEMAVVWPLGIGVGPSGVQGANRLAGRDWAGPFWEGAAGAFWPLAPASAGAWPLEDPAAPVSCIWRSISRILRIAPLRRSGWKSPSAL